MRIQAFREKEPADYHRQTGHFVYSPSEPPQTLRELRELRKEAYETAKEKGVRGGTVVLHPWRLKDAVLERYRETETDVGAWVWVRKEYGENWREAAVWSPHAHVVGLMSPDMEPGKGSGDVWHLIDTMGAYHGPNDKKSHDELYGTFRYLLSHALVPTEETDDNIRTRTWFGELHGSVFDPEEEIGTATYRRLKRVVNEVAERSPDEDRGESENDEEETECPVEDCEGEVIDVLETPRYLDSVDPPDIVSRR
ncbi:MAG: hypothetical protein ABEI99_02770, partial [Halobaculum sp.]